MEEHDAVKKEKESKKGKIDKKHEELKQNVLTELKIVEEKSRNAAGGWNRPTLTEQLWEVELERRKRVKQEERMANIYKQEEDRQHGLEAEKWKSEMLKKEEEQRKQEDEEESDEMVLIDYLQFSEKKKCQNEREQSYWIEDINKRMKGKETLINRMCEEQPRVRYNTHRGLESEKQELKEKKEEGKERALEEQRKEIERLRELDKRKKIKRQKTLKEKWKEKERKIEEERLGVLEEKKRKEETKAVLWEKRREEERQRKLEEKTKRELEEKMKEEKRQRALEEKQIKEERLRKFEEQWIKEERQRELEDKMKEEEKKRELEEKWIKEERLSALKNIKTKMQEKKKEQRRQQEEEEIKGITTFSETEKWQNEREQETEKIMEINKRMKEREEKVSINRMWEDSCQCPRVCISSNTPDSKSVEHLNLRKEPKAEEQELRRRLEVRLQRNMTESEEIEDEDEKDMKLKLAFGHIGKVMKKTYQKVVDFTKSSSNNFEESRRQHVTRLLHFTLQDLEEAKMQLILERQNIGMTQDQQRGQKVFFNAL